MRHIPDRNGPETHILPTLDLVSSAGNILLQWTGGDYWNDTPPDQLRHQHRLDEGEWSRAQRHHAFTFISLDEGPHRIEVRAIDRDGNIDPTPAFHAFIVEGPWWKNPYIAVSGLVMLGLIALQTGRVVRRDRRVREANQELMVEAALERVRAQALGMQNSNELSDVAGTLKEELDRLGLPPSQPYFLFPDEEAQTSELWVQGTGVQPRVLTISYSDWIQNQAGFEQQLAAWKRGSSESLYEMDVEETQRGQEWWEELNKDVPTGARPQHDLDGRARLIYGFNFEHGILFLVVGDARLLSVTNRATARRFTDVFAFAYDRFLELKEKEAQARQAERQAAVARVRAEAAAMRRAEDLEEVVKEIIKELTGVGVKFTGGSIQVVDEEAGVRLQYGGLTEGLAAKLEELPLTEVSEEWMMIWKGGKAVVRHREMARHKAEILGRSVENLPREVVLDAPFTYGTFALAVEEPGDFSEEEIALVADFAEVISLGYARYLDFQKLEAQNEAMSEANRELFQVNVDLQREQVLERLRGQAQGMQSSEDIGPVVEAVYRELSELGLPLFGATIYIANETEIEAWPTLLDGRAADPVISPRSKEVDALVRDVLSRGDDYIYEHVEGQEARDRQRGAIEMGMPRWRDVPEEQWPEAFDK